MQRETSCPFHGTNLKPRLCHRCQHVRLSKIDFEKEVEGTLERVVTTCPETGRQRISYKVIGNLRIKNDPHRPWRYSS